jgi:hypothetical protein
MRPFRASTSLRAGPYKAFKGLKALEGLLRPLRALSGLSFIRPLRALYSQAARNIRFRMGPLSANWVPGLGPWPLGPR